MALANFTLRRGKAPRPPWVTTVILGLVLVGVVVGLVMIWPGARRSASAITPTRELANLKTLAQALRMHAEEHEGKLPNSVANIEWRQNLLGLDRDGLPAAVSQFHDPATGKEYKWIYYPGHSLTDPPETIVAAAPFPVGTGKDRRLIVRLNSVAESISEGEFQKQIADQSANVPSGL